MAKKIFAKKTKIVFLIRFLFPYLFLASAFLLFLIFENSISKTADVLYTFVSPFAFSSLFLFFLYIFLIESPASFAFSVREAFNRNPQTPSSLWPLLEQTIKKRRFAITLLFIILSAVLFLNIFFFLSLRHKLLNEKETTSFIIVFVFGLIVLFMVLVPELLTYGKVSLSESTHKDKEELRRVIENISITAGVAVPDFKILIHKRPTAFSICPNFAKPIIYVTTAMLNLADKNEIEAVIAHEISYIFPKKFLTTEQSITSLFF